MVKSHIQWTDSTVNFWTGCQKVSDGCKFCYMYRDKHKYGQEPSIVKRTSPATFNQALKWKSSKKIFTCSWSDFFISNADIWRNDAWDIIRQTPQHHWQILTKRPERVLQCLPKDWGSGWDNVWLGVSVESQKYMYRIEELSKIPAKTRFISAEPLLGELDFTNHLDILKMYHWCIIGGESGNENGVWKYRACELQWIEKILVDLKDTGVSIFVKQLGTYLSKKLGCKDRHGGEIAEWPEHIQVRDFPQNELLKTNQILCNKTI